MYVSVRVCIRVCVSRAGNKNQKVIRNFSVSPKNCEFLYKLISSDLLLVINIDSQLSLQ